MARGGTPPIPSLHKEITLSKEILARYLGTYQFPHYSLKIVPEDKHLLAEFADGVTFPIFAESETKFFAKLWPVQFEFSIRTIVVSGQSLRDIRVTKKKRASRDNHLS